MRSTETAWLASVTGFCNSLAVQSAFCCLPAAILDTSDAAPLQLYAVHAVRNAVCPDPVADVQVLLAPKLSLLLALAQNTFAVP